MVKSRPAAPHGLRPAEVVDAGPGQQSLVVAAECGGMKFVAGIDVPRGGKVTTGMFGGTISCLFIY